MIVAGESGEILIDHMLLKHERQANNTYDKCSETSLELCSINHTRTTVNFLLCFLALYFIGQSGLPPDEQTQDDTSGGDDGDLGGLFTVHQSTGATSSEDMSATVAERSFGKEVCAASRYHGIDSSLPPVRVTHWDEKVSLLGLLVFWGEICIGCW